MEPDGMPFLQLLRRLLSLIPQLSVKNPKYTIFFKAKDADVLTAIVQDYTAKQLSRKEHPSVLKELAKLKAIVAAIPQKIRHREQEHTL